MPYRKLLGKGDNSRPAVKGKQGGYKGDAAPPALKGKEEPLRYKYSWREALNHSRKKLKALDSEKLAKERVYYIPPDVRHAEVVDERANVVSRSDFRGDNKSKVDRERRSARKAKFDPTGMKKQRREIATQALTVTEAKAAWEAAITLARNNIRGFLSQKSDTGTVYDGVLERVPKAHRKSFHEHVEGDKLQFWHGHEADEEEPLVGGGKPGDR